ncbi:MAG: transketolase [Dehalococcoidia bacterium]
MPTFDQLCINTIRFLAVDAVQKANSGHPGAPMGMAPMAYVLWDQFLKHNPADPKWPNRDRFVLSAGHASALLYALLHLTGYDVSLDEVKNFRQWGSITPGHPEYGLTPGVETTSGPLGQGFANGVGMAIAEKSLAAHYNRPGFNIIDHHIYAFVSDGDLEEGVTAEAASLAGTLKLGKIIYFYDDNDISIEGNTDITFTEDVKQRFEAYGWHVTRPVNGLRLNEVSAAFREAQQETNRPSLIICKTIIGYGSPNKANTGGVHGEPLGEEEVRLSKENLRWQYTAEPFAIPKEVQEHFRQAIQRGRQQQEEWEALMGDYRQKYPQEAYQLECDMSGEIPFGWDSDLPDLFTSSEKPIATRAASGQVLNAIAPKIHALMGGSADLAPSNKSIMKDRGDFGANDYTGHNLHFGIREHAMGAICNGLALHGGKIPYAATFLAFYDYMRPPVRLAAMMGLRVIFIFSHDSIGVGEDGPTHQPIEHLLGLRSVPNLVMIRPADATETVEAWKIALERRDGPTALVLSRQGVPVLDRASLAAADGVRRGGYVLWESSSSPEAIIIATGSEVHIAFQAAQRLADNGIKPRVVSLPSWELFEAQPKDYRNEVLPPEIRARVSIEAGTPLGWERYVGMDGIIIGVPRFGASAPMKVIYEKLGLTSQQVVDAVTSLVGERKT